MRSMNIGLLSYINALPINYFLNDILKDIKSISYKLFYEPPNILSKQYKNHILSGSFIPLFDFLDSDFYLDNYIFSNIGISSQKKVDSVLLFYNKDLKNVKTIGIDHHSLSSQYLLKILIQSFFKMDCTFLKFDPYNTTIKKKFDAYLLIGDIAILEKNYIQTYYDLAQLWYNWTKLPFTFCIFTSKKKDSLLKNALVKSKDLGLKNLEQIISKLPPYKANFLYNYFTNNLLFDINKQSIFLYQKLLIENNFISKKKNICFYE